MNEDEIRKIYRMFSAKCPSRQIALETGQDEAEIKKLRRAWRNAGRPSAPQTAAGGISDDSITPARDGSRAPAPVLTRFNPPQPETDKNTPEAWQAAIRHGMAGLIAYTEDEIMAASGIADHRERTYAITSLLKILSSQYAKMGSWAGMDHPPEIMQEAYVDVVWEAMASTKDEPDALIEIPKESAFYHDDVGGKQYDYHNAIYSFGGNAEAAEEFNRTYTNAEPIYVIDSLTDLGRLSDEDQTPAEGDDQ